MKRSSISQFRDDTFVSVVGSSVRVLAAESDVRSAPGTPKRGSIIQVMGDGEPAILSESKSLSSVSSDGLRGWLWKQGGAKGGRKSWKRRWFVLKDDCLFYYDSGDRGVLLGVMPLASARVLDLAAAVQQAPPWEEAKVCFECKRPFSWTNPRHSCRHCGRSFCGPDSSQRIEIPKFGFNSKVRVCDECFQTLKNSQTNKQEGNIKSHSGAPLVIRPNADPSHSRYLSDFTLPTGNKPNLFSIKNSERELWLRAENEADRLNWIQAIVEVRRVQSQPKQQAPQSGPGVAARPAAPPWDLDYASLTILNKIGNGAFGEIHKGRIWGTDCVVKTLKARDFASDEKLLDELKKEVSILSQLRHPNVVLYIGCTRPPNVSIVMEYCPKGSLFDLLHDGKTFINARTIIQLAMGIAQGMNYLHSLPKKIMHRDLKAANILVSSLFSPKITDFGLSHVKERHTRDSIVLSSGSALALTQSAAETQTKSNSSKSPANAPLSSSSDCEVLGSMQWMAPEVLEGQRYNEKVDCYSYGVVLCEIVSRLLPYQDQTAIESYNDILDHVLDNGAIPTIPNWCEHFLRPLILDCLSRVPASRPSFNEIILRLREFVDLPDSVYFFQLDLPRLREQLFDSAPAVQALAANELAHILRQNKRIKRISDTEADSDGTGAMSPIIHRRTERRSPTLGPANQTLKENEKEGDAASSSVIKEDSAVWVLDDDDCAVFYERLISLLGSAEKRVQLAACRAIHSLLAACGDAEKRRQDRELIVNENGIPQLMALMSSNATDELAAEAGGVLLMLAADLHHFQLFSSDDTAALQQFHSLVDIELANSHRALKEIQQKIDRQRELQRTLHKNIQDNVEKEREREAGGNATKFKKPVRKSKMRPATLSSFMGNGNGLQENQTIAEEIEDGDSDTRENEVNEEAKSDADRPIIVDQAADGAHWEAKFSAPDPPASVDQRRLESLAQLLASLRNPLSTTVPAHWVDYYGSILCRGCQPALQWVSLYREWKPVHLLVLKEELRIFTALDDAPDDQLLAIRTRTQVQGKQTVTAVEIGQFAGVPNCITIADCGEKYTLCLGDPDRARIVQSAIRDEQDHKRDSNADRSQPENTQNSTNAAPLPTAPAASTASAGSLFTSSPSAAAPPLDVSFFPISWRPFVLHFGHALVHCGYLYRQKRYSGLWVRAWFALVAAGQQLHYYSDPLADPAKPEGTIYLATNSGKEFERKASNKRQFAFSIAAPGHTAHLAADGASTLAEWQQKLDEAAKRHQAIKTNEKHKANNHSQK